MATSNFLDDVLNAEPDAAVVSALVGSLESQLSSTTSASSDVLLIDANHSTNSVNSNSINASTNHAFRTATAASPAASAASSVAISASVSALAGNGLSGHAVSSTPIPGTAVLTSTNCNSIPATHTGSAPPAPTSSAPTPTHQQQHINSVHSLLPNGNPTGLVVTTGPQQVANSGTTTTLHNGTIQQPASGTATNMALPGLVIQQPPQKLTGQQQGSQLQPTMIIPAKVPTTLVGQQPPMGANGTAPVIQQQILRPATQIQQQQQQPQQQAVINSAGGMLAPGVQVVNMNAVRGSPASVQNISTLSNSPAHRQLAPRVVLAPQVGARPGQVGITLQALQGFQAAGAQGHLLVKTESGQYQLLRVGPGVVPGTAMAQPATTQPVQTIQASAAPGTQTVQTIPSAAVQNVAGAQIGGTYRVQVPVGSNVQPVSSAVNTTAVAPQTSAPTSAPVSSAPATTTNSGSGGGGGNSGQMTPDTAKVKCKNFLSTLLRLANEQPESVASNVRMLIQGLVDAKVEPEEFTTKLQRELNSSPQPCLIPFLKKSLPFLRHSLATKELTIEGIRPPALATSQPPGTISQTVITQQQHLQQTQVVNRQVVTVPNQVQTARPLGAGIIRTAAPTTMTAATAAAASPRPTKVAATNKATPKQTKAQQQHAGASKVPAGVFKSEASSGSTASSTDSTPISFTISLPPGSTAPAVPASTAVAATSSANSTAVTTTSTAALSASVASPGIFNKSAPGTPAGALSAAARASLAASKDKEKKSSNFSSSLVGLSGDDDINDVAAMGGVNLAEESQRILGSTEMIGTQIRSCKDENFLFTGPLTRRVQEIVSRHGLGDTSSELVSLISHATQERLKTLLEKLAVIAEHRMEAVKTDSRYEVHQDVKGQLKFLEELDKLERRRHTEIQREMLLKAAKSRSKAEDPEQAKLKAKAKEMQRAEMEELRQREANLTALQAIGQRKKPRLDLAGTTGSFNQVPLRPRVKRVNVRDLLFLLEEEKATARSPMLYKAYLK